MINSIILGGCLLFSGLWLISAFEANAANDEELSWQTEPPDFRANQPMKTPDPIQPPWYYHITGHPENLIEKALALWSLQLVVVFPALCPLLLATLLY